MSREHFTNSDDYEEVVQRLRLTRTEVLLGILEQTPVYILAAVEEEIRAILAERAHGK